MERVAEETYGAAEERKRQFGHAGDEEHERADGHGAAGEPAFTLVIDSDGGPGPGRLTGPG